MIHREDHDDIAVLRMDHGKVQALDVELLDDLARALTEVDAEGVRAVVLTGTGKTFSAGVDLVRVVDGGRAYLDRFLPLLTDVLLRLFVLPRPLVAAINGHAIAGGCLFAAASDHRVLADGEARIGVPELLVGVPFPLIALEILRFAAPGAHLQELVYGGRNHSSADALRLRLADEVAPAESVLPRALAVARQLAQVPAESFRIVKASLRRPALERFESGRAHIDAQVDAAWGSPEVQQAIRRYLEELRRRRG